MNRRFSGLVGGMSGGVGAGITPGGGGSKKASDMSPFDGAPVRNLVWKGLSDADRSQGLEDMTFPELLE